MIDFRYHLVSLISVFLALAVGIVLGAGPLRESLGDQLSTQVEQLRTEQDALRVEAEDLASQNDQLASFITEIGPELVDATLPGAQIAVLTDDSSTRSSVERMVSLLEDAGAGSVVTVSLETSMWEPAQADVRAEAVAEIAAIAPALLTSGDAGVDDAEALSALIVTLLQPQGPEDLTADLRGQVWQVLQDKQLIAVDGGDIGTVDGVVYAAAEQSVFVDESDDDATAAERAQGQLSAQTAMLVALTGSGLPAVVAGATPGNDGTVSLLRTVRGDVRFASLSTTDRLQAADGPVLAVLALIEQTRGGSGAYGTTTEADDRLPALPEVQSALAGQATTETPDATATDGAGTDGTDGTDGADSGSIASDAGGEADG
ncbi:copper transporter [Brachybacterium sp. DNPG3]